MEVKKEENQKANLEVNQEVNQKVKIKCNKWWWEEKIVDVVMKMVEKLLKKNKIK